MNDQGLHLVLKDNTQYFKEDYGVLELPKAGGFTVGIKEFDEELATADTPEKKKAVQAKYATVNWVFATAKGSIDPKYLNHNKTVGKGITEGGKTLTFPKLLEGGGLGYVEAFFPKPKANEDASSTTETKKDTEQQYGIGPVGSVSNGLLVQAMGVPAIVRAEWSEWTGKEFKPIENEVKFGSSLYLHIYTQALYGQEIEIEMAEDDIWADESLKGNTTGEVKTFDVLAFDEGKGVSGNLNETEEGKEKSVSNVQKAVVQVTASTHWTDNLNDALTKGLEVYPCIKLKRTGEFFEGFTRNLLNVSGQGELEIKQLPESNQAVVVGTVETNEAAFHPCHYTKLEYTDDDGGSHPLFTAKKGVDPNPNLEVGIIAGSDEKGAKKFKYKIGGTVETLDCLYEDEPHDHEKQMFFYDESSVPANFTVDDTPRQLSGTAKFDYGGNIFNYIWPAKPISGELPSFVAHANSCRYSKTIKTVVYPEIKWELAALIIVPKTSKTTFKFKKTRKDLTGYHNQFGFEFTDRSLEIKGEKEEKLGVGISLKAFVNDAPQKFDLKIEKSIKKVIGVFNAVYSGIKMFSSSETDVSNSAAVSKKLVSKFEFVIDPPNVGVALKWQNELAKLGEDKGKVGWRMDGGIALRPFIGIGIVVDLIPVLGSFGPVAKTVQWILNALEAVTGADIYFLFKLNAEIAGKLSIGYHSLDGWDEGAKKSLSVTVRASIEAGLDYEGEVLVAIIKPGNIKYEEVDTFAIAGSLGTGVTYKEVWGSDHKGMYKEITVIFLGATAKFEVYSATLKRKKNLNKDDAKWQMKDVERNEGGFSKSYDGTLLGYDEWYGPKKIYLDEN